MKISASVLKKIAPAGKASIIANIEKYGPAILDKYKINTKLRVAHFLAQLAHESDQFKTTEEYASGSAYEGRKDLGNTVKGDGKRFKGRGLIQLTGRANYKTYGDLLGLDLIGNPELAEQFPAALEIAAAYWNKKGLNKYADIDDVLTITKRINGGTNGLADRKTKLATAKKYINEIFAETPKVETETLQPFLKKGMKGEGVVSLQNALIKAGYNLVADGDFGNATDKAVRDFQKKNKLDVDGKVGSATWYKLL